MNLASHGIRWITGEEELTRERSLYGTVDLDEGKER